MRRANRLVVAGVSVAALSGAWWLGRAGATSNVTPPPAEARVTAVAFAAPPPREAPLPFEPAAMMPAMSPAPRDKATAPQSEDKPPPDAEAERKRLADLFAKHRADHEREPDDARWARATEARLDGNLRALAGVRANRVVGVSCRTTSCLATLEWSSYDKARKASSDLATAHYGAACSTWVHMPRPESPSGAYQATVYFDCLPSRSGR